MFYSPCVQMKSNSFLSIASLNTSNYYRRYACCLDLSLISSFPTCLLQYKMKTEQRATSSHDIQKFGDLHLKLRCAPKFGTSTSATGDRQTKPLSLSTDHH